MRRAVVSAPPAGGYGTMTRTGRFGQAACALAVPANGAAAIAASIVRRVRSIPDMDRPFSFDGNLAEDPVPVNAPMPRWAQKCRRISAARALLDCGCKRSRSVDDTTNDPTASPCAWATASTAVAATRGIGLIQITRADPARDRNAARRAGRPGVGESFLPADTTI